LFNYRKAFDLIDHNILVHKIRKLSIPLPIINWIIDFLTSPGIVSPNGEKFPPEFPKGQN
jgi:hypothetical protein